MSEPFSGFSEDLKSDWQAVRAGARELYDDRGILKKDTSAQQVLDLRARVMGIDKRMQEEYPPLGKDAIEARARNQCVQEYLDPSHHSAERKEFASWYDAAHERGISNDHVTRDYYAEEVALVMSHLQARFDFYDCVKNKMQASEPPRRDMEESATPEVSPSSPEAPPHYSSPPPSTNPSRNR